QIEYVRQLIKKTAHERIIENFYNQNLDPTDFLHEIDIKIQDIFNSFKNEKLYELKNHPKIDVLIIPDALIANWKIEFNTKAKVLSLKEFLKIQNEYQAVKSVCLVSIFGNGYYPDE